jgi:hypothetical protein
MSGDGSGGDAPVYEDSLFQRCWCALCDYTFNANITGSNKGDKIDCLKECGSIVGVVSGGYVGDSYGTRDT